MTRAFALALAVIALAPQGAAAHALDEYVQVSRLSLTRTRISLDMDLTPGAVTAASIVALIDRDEDGVVSPTEAADYGRRLLGDLGVELDGQRVAMTLVRIDVAPVGELREGIGTIRVSAIGAHGSHLVGQARLSFRNDHDPERSAYSVNAMVPADRTLSVFRQDRDRSQRSIDILYDVRPALPGQIGWAILGAVTCLLLIVVRRSPIGPASLPARAISASSSVRSRARDVEPAASPSARTA
jgi:hypothetical protein